MRLQNARNSEALLSRNELRRFNNGRNVDDNIAAVGLRGDADGITSALLTDGGDVNRRGTVAANHVLAVLALALRATNHTGIQGRAVAIGLLDHHEADWTAIGVQSEEMEIAVLHFANGDMNQAIDGLHGASA